MQWPSLDRIALAVRETTGAAGLAPYRVAERDRVLPERWVAASVDFGASPRSTLQLFVPLASPLARDLAALRGLAGAVLKQLLPQSSQQDAALRWPPRVKVRCLDRSELPPRDHSGPGRSLMFVDTEGHPLGIALALAPQRPASARMPCFLSLA